MTIRVGLVLVYLVGAALTFLWANRHKEDDAVFVRSALGDRTPEAMRTQHHELLAACWFLVIPPMILLAIGCGVLGAILVVADWGRGSEVQWPGRSIGSRDE